MRKNLLMALSAILPAFYSPAQVSVTSVNYNTVSLNETNVLQALVMNNGSAVQATASISCKNAGGDIIIEALSKPFTLNTGINNINGLVTGFSRFAYGHSGQALYVKNNGLLPSGNFVYCLKINVLANGEEGDIFCEDFVSATDDFLNLVVPYDKDTIDTGFPVLTWMHSEPFSVLARNEYYKITVCEMRGEQTPEQAILSNPAVFTKSFLSAHSVPYPADAPALQQGRSYAWQVQKISGNTIVNKTEAWQFYLVKPVVREPAKYAALKDKPDAGYYTCVDGVLYFRFNEEYHSTELVYELYDDRNKKIAVEIRKDNADEQPLPTLTKKTGMNTFELNLDRYGLKQGFYLLIVYNEKHQKRYLKFYVEK